MRDAKLAILEDQLDTLAGRLADAEERFELLLKVLTTGQVPKKLGLKAAEIKSRCQAVVPGSRRWHHADERSSRLAKAHLDDFRRSVANAESLAELSGKPFLEAFAAVRDEDDEEDNTHTTAAAAGPTIWHQVLTRLATVVNRYSFVTWLEPTTLVRDDGDTMVVRAPDRLGAEWLTKHYTEVVSAALAAVGRPETSVTFIANDDEQPDS